MFVFKVGSCDFFFFFNGRLSVYSVALENKFSFILTPPSQAFHS